MTVPGVVKCGRCGLDVPDSIYCISCGKRTDYTSPPNLGDREYEVLLKVSELCKKKDAVKIVEVHQALGNGKEAIRVVLSNLFKKGLLERPTRGRYRLNQYAKNLLEQGRN